MKILTLIILLSAIPPVVTAQIDTRSDIGTDEKIEGLARFWSEAKYNFAYFDQAGLDWDQTFREYLPRVMETESTWEYYLVMREFSALLKDGHTDITLPARLVETKMHRPVELGYTEGGYYVKNVNRKEQDLLPVGSVLEKVEGQPADQWFRSLIDPYISASGESSARNKAAYALYHQLPDTVQTLQMTFTAPNGDPVVYFYRYRSAPVEWAIAKKPAGIYRLTLLENNIVHIELNSFGDRKIVDRFLDDLPVIEKAQGVILDLRRNGGGNSNIGAAILMHFTEADTLTGSAWRTRSHQAAFRAWGRSVRVNNPDMTIEQAEGWARKSLAVYEGDYWFDGGVSKFINDTGKELKDKPVIVLAGNRTASAAEDLLVILRQLPDRQIPVIGSHTMGSTGQPLLIDLPGGGRARICTKRDTFADGTDFVGTGIVPDVEVIPSIQNLVLGEDVVLEKALDIVGN